MKNNSSSRPVRIRDIAEAVGVSQMTVSLALRNSTRISEARRREVREAARRMGYRPNAMASMLAHFRHGHKTKPVQAAIAWVNLMHEPEKLRRDYKEFDRYWEGAIATAEKLGYHLDEIVCNKGMTAAALQKILTARGIDGVLLPPLLTNTELPKGWDEFNWDLFSVVRFGRSRYNLSTHLVTADQTANTILAFEKIFSLGYQRIGMVQDEMGSRMFFDSGFLKAQLLAPHALRLPICMLDFRNSSQAHAQFNQWLNEETPDAIFTSTPHLPDMLKRAGFQIGDDIGVATSTILDGKVDAGIYQNPEEIGRVAVLQLLSMMHDGERGIPEINREVLVEGSWVDGSSLPRRN
jgi:LacI family transcriptional regulator